MESHGLYRLDGLDEDSEALFNAVNKEDDLPCVLLSVSYLDKLVLKLLNKSLINSSESKNLLDPLKGGVIGTYMARIKLCYGLGVISKGLYDNLKLVGKIRNLMAHSCLDISFDDPEITKICNTLLFPEMKGVTYRGNTGQTEDLSPKEFFKKFENPRHRFTFTVVMIANELKLTQTTTPSSPYEKWKIQD